ncbi:hypothetical protein Pint_12916 [Pistacia integerrima]|uniref:Uncharacterized protein n=1 Tax=Pistacia integerrima TaxID=434235 RepID=A0ACC0Y959_9ROSI|nr:hypothetical protein Pint_12916 [Pistacia integerrima]
MAFSKASVITFMMAVVVAAMALGGAAQEAVSPAPAPHSGTGSISSSMASAGLALVVALLFGSTLRI